MSHIVAVSENGVIGNNNDLIWHFTDDLKYFKRRTTGKVMIMGRKTFESFKKPLPGRYHIVISRSAHSEDSEVVKFVSSIDEAYRWAERLTLSGQWPEEVMIIGGGQIYEATRKDADFLYITRIPGEYKGDTYYSLNIPSHYKIAFSQFSETHPGLRWEIWSKEQTEID